jgi:hypothetical protein
MNNRRFTTMLLLLMFTLFFFESCYLRCQESSEGPHMVLEEDVFDFGKVDQGEVLTHVFRFDNCGNDTLRIKRVRGT